MGLPFPIPGDLPDPEIELESLASPILSVHGVVKSWTRLRDQHFHFSNVQLCLLNEWMHACCLLSRFSGFLPLYGLQSIVSSVHVILQARTLEWLARSCSRGSSRWHLLRLLHCRWGGYCWATRKPKWMNAWLYYNSFTDLCLILMASCKPPQQIILTESWLPTSQQRMKVYLKELPIDWDSGFLPSQVTEIIYKCLKDQG